MSDRAVLDEKKPFRLRRSRCLVGSWDGDEFVFENFLTGQRTTVDPLLAHLLRRFEQYLPWSEAVGSVERIPCSAALLNELVSQGVLVREGSSLDQRESAVEREWRWGLDARHFHYSTRQVVFEDLESEAALLGRLAREEPAPSPYKSCGPVKVELPASSKRRREEFFRVLRARRTLRRFRREPISLDEFSDVLFWTWGQMKRCEDQLLGPYVLKTSPSGGARHPIEVYAVVSRVEGVPPGVYHYSVASHGLEIVGGGVSEELIASLCAGQAWVQDAAVVFFMTAVLQRSTWKYRHSHAYRVLLLDAGHLGQTFHLVCTRMGLAPFTFAAFDAPGVEATLGLDGVSEVALYAAATGYPMSSTEEQAAL